MAASANSKVKGFGFMFLSSSLMGGIGAFARYINTSGDFISFCRSLSGFICMALLFVVGGRLVKLRRTRVSAAVVFSGMFLGLLSMLYVLSTQMTTLANAAFLIYTGPVYSTVLATIFLKEPFTKVTAGSLASVFLGCLMIVGIINYTAGEGFTVGLDLDPRYMVGNMVALASGVAYGLFLFISRYRTDVDTDVRAFYNFLFAILTIGTILLFRTPDLSGMDTQSWAVLVVAALVTGFGAFFFLTLAAKILLAAELATISYQETIMASILGIALFSESLTVVQALGGILIVGGGVAQIMASRAGGTNELAASTAGSGTGAEVEAPSAARPSRAVESPAEFVSRSR